MLPSEISHQSVEPLIERTVDDLDDVALAQPGDAGFARGRPGAHGQEIGGRGNVIAGRPGRIARRIGRRRLCGRLLASSLLGLAVERGEVHARHPAIDLPDRDRPPADAVIGRDRVELVHARDRRCCHRAPR